MARSALESFLVFSYVFAGPKTDEERELRNLSWVLADLMERQEFPTTLPEHKQKLEREAEGIQSLTELIKSKPIFKTMNRGEQRALLERRRWKVKGWAEIARDAGFGPVTSDQLYRYL